MVRSALSISTTPGFPSRLAWKDAFLFPVETPEARRDLLIGGTLILLLWPIGWILNLGNRLGVVARLHRDERPYFTGFRPWRTTFSRGCRAALAIAAYLSPAVLLAALTYLSVASRAATPWIVMPGVLSVAAFVLAVFTLPGGMTVFAVEGDASVLRSPARAFRRAWSRRSIYLRAWVIGLSSIVLSFLGLAAAGIGFLYTSVWAWEVVGYAFTVAMYLPSPAEERSR